MKGKSEKIKVLKDGSVTSPMGFHAGGLFCGLRKKRLDIGWLMSEVPAAAAGVFTVNQFQAAPLLVTQESLNEQGILQGIIVNSGNANACTGLKGLEDAYEMRSLFAGKMAIPEYTAAVVSTGVIGVPLPMEKIFDGIHAIPSTPMQWNVNDFELAILTTDTCTKHAAAELIIDGKKVHIGGAAKGSGMIHPNMATMLGFVTTDANIDKATLKKALSQAVNKTFNQITVDGDTSTNDMVLILANGLAENQLLSPSHPEWDIFMEGLEEICKELAKKIARDGEGATKLIEVIVKGAQSEEAAKVIGKSVVGSSLVKSAIFGKDANWGRIICAAGYGGIPLELEKIVLHLGPYEIVSNGQSSPFSEEEVKAYLEKNESIQIQLDVGDGSGESVSWGCDLTYDYVRINASYRT
ncbi:bifunctional glutamate N-acetyltransferase/amino-acid acetyltransferase ArgJ [Falsibacillus albus]|uniref:Arginine biosynthesis bifunctional protein ArgJ n=1 Tax=Falsibacillus albus TaxID=2478915 RepID=A0A3L7JZV9_9BACI|nr:bifunctional glutamate N-acetyltransferase/amino-acid acetyltransferase ArgJ [Falsibacillus albus]